MIHHVYTTRSLRTESTLKGHLIVCKTYINAPYKRDGIIYFEKKSINSLIRVSFQLQYKEEINDIIKMKTFDFISETDFLIYYYFYLLI